MPLTLLELRHADALEAFLAEFDDAPDDLHGYFCERDATIEQAVHLLVAWERGEELADGWVPCTTLFWEVDGALAGVVNIRHDLSEGLREIGGHIGYSVARSHRRQGVATKMLACAIDVCRDLGIERALLTVDSDNIASQRVIERNGGVLEREGPAGEEQVLQRWYWIDVAP